MVAARTGVMEFVNAGNFCTSRSSVFLSHDWHSLVLDGKKPTGGNNSLLNGRSTNSVPGRQIEVVPSVVKSKKECN